jgi:hypothetical protein
MWYNNYSKGEEIPKKREVNKMAEFSIILNGKIIAEVDGTECAYEVYHKAEEIADIIGGQVSLKDNIKGEIIANNHED